jgi:hypothetical protein
MIHAREAFMVWRLSPVLALIVLACTPRGIDENRALFEHIPNNPELLVMVRPNELTEFSQKALVDLVLKDAVDPRWNLDAGKVEEYRLLAISLFEALGLPWSDIRSLGVMIFMEQPVFLASGHFHKEVVEKRIADLGFTRNADGSFNYVYEGQRLLLPADGLIMLAEPEVLQFLRSIAAEDRLWNRPDFETYRSTTPLDNTLFLWSDPPEQLFGDFPYREELGSLSLALNLKVGLSFKFVARLKSPERTVMLADMMLGAITFARGAFGSDQDYGRLFQALQVNHDQTRVETTMVLGAADALRLRDRIAADLKQPSSTTFDGFQRFFEMVK